MHCRSDHRTRIVAVIMQGPVSAKPKTLHVVAAFVDV
jgi:hypothetical protein